MSTDDYQPTRKQDPDEYSPEIQEYYQGLGLVGKRLFDRYEIFEARQGGVGLVYFVTDLANQQEYAVKTIRPEYIHVFPVEQFVQEIDFWIQMESHPHIVRAYFVELADQVPYLFLERVYGGPQTSLRDHLRASGPMSEESSAALIYQLCLGMEFANRKGEIVHADLKPENLLLDTKRVLKITDFGLAHRLQMIRGQYPRVQMGSWPYAPPERFKDEIENCQSDIYSVGMIWYEMLTGRLPFSFALEKDPKRQYEQLRDFHKTSEGLGSDIYYGKISGLTDAPRQILSDCLMHYAAQRRHNFTDLRELLEDAYPRLKYTKKDPGVPPSSDLYERARSLMKIGQYSQALRLFNRLLQQQPGNARYWMDAGLCYLGVENYSSGISCIKKALAIDPGLESELDNMPLIKEQVKKG